MIRQLFLGARRFAGARQASSAIEFAIISPIVMLIVFGIIVYGLLFGASHMVQHMATEAARATVPGLTTAERDALARASIANSLANQSLIRPSDLEIKVGDDPLDPDTYVVELNLDARSLGIMTFASLVPMPPSFVSRTVRIRRGGL